MLWILPVIIIGIVWALTTLWVLAGVSLVTRDEITEPIDDLDRE